MKEVKGYILKNWFWIAAGLMLTEISAKEAYEQRGYLAYGGEWFSLPFVLMAVGMARNACGTIRSLFTKESEYGED